MDAWGNYIRVGQITKPMAYDLIRKEADRLEEAGKGTHKVNAMIRILRAAWYYFIDVLDLEKPFQENEALFCGQ